LNQAKTVSSHIFAIHYSVPPRHSTLHSLSHLQRLTIQSTQYNTIQYNTILTAVVRIDMKLEILHSLQRQLDQHIFLIHLKIYKEIQSKYRIYVITFVCVNIRGLEL